VLPVGVTQAGPIGDRQAATARTLPGVADRLTRAPPGMVSTGSPLRGVANWRGWSYKERPIGAADPLPFAPCPMKNLALSAIASASILGTVAVAILTPCTPENRAPMAALILAGSIGVPALVLSQVDR